MLQLNNDRQQYATPKKDDAIDLLGMVRRRRGVLAFGTLLGIAAAAFYYFTTTPVYESETQILVMTRNASQEGSDSNDSQVVHQDVLATHMELFTSQKIVESAITKRGLTQLFSVSEAIANNDDPVDFIMDHVKVTRGGSGRGKEANIIKASYRDVSPSDCATILDALVESYQQFLGDTFLNSSDEAVKLITQAKKDLAKELDEHSTEYREFRENIPFVFSGDQMTNPHQEKLDNLEDELGELRKKQSEITSRTEVIEEFRVGTEGRALTDIECLSLLSEDEVIRLKVLFDVTKQDQYSQAFQADQPIRNESARAEYQQLLTLILREKTLSTRYGDDHPQVKMVRDNIVAMRSFFDSNKVAQPVEGKIDQMLPSEMLETFLGSLKNDLSETKKRETKLMALAKTESTAAREMVQYELQDKAMQAETTRLNALYDAIVERLRDMNISKDFGGFITEVISPAKPQIKPVWPKLSILGGLGGLLGLTFGIGLALLGELTDTTFKNPLDVQRAMDLPIIGHIPRLQLKTKQAKASKYDASLCTLLQPRSRDAEVYRSLRTAISFSSNRDCMKVLQLTSSSPGEGKSTTASNLAVSFSQIGKKVLLVDADLRRPRVDKLFNLSKGPGLTHVLADDVKPADAIRTEMSETLHLLPAGRIPENPAELLSSPKFEAMLNELKDQYDIIILDTPPVLAVSDPRIIASLADGVVIAVRIVKDGRAATVHCREVLDSVGANLLGVVINSTNSQVGHYGYTDGASNVGYGFEYGNEYYRKEATVSKS